MFLGVLIAWAVLIAVVLWSVIYDRDTADEVTPHARPWLAIDERSPKAKARARVAREGRRA